jgi:hypothetical protein
MKRCENCNNFNSNGEGLTYGHCRRMIAEVKPIGYTVNKGYSCCHHGEVFEDNRIWVEEQKKYFVPMEELENSYDIIKALLRGNKKLDAKLRKFFKMKEKKNGK